MQLQPDGDLAVSMQETITVEIVARDTAFLAHTGPLQAGNWTSISHPNATTQIRTFVVTPKFSKNFFFAIGFDFSPANGGAIPVTAQYTVKITGSGPGGFVRLRVILPVPILPTSRVFPFEVGQG